MSPLKNCDAILASPFQPRVRLRKSWGPQVCEPAGSVPIFRVIKSWVHKKDMTTTISEEILIAYSQCPRKAYFLSYTAERGQSHEYQQILKQNQIANQHKHLDALGHKPNVYPYSVENLKKGYDFLINARLIVDELQADCAGLS